MKSFLQILLFFLLVTQLHYPQWTNQNPVPDVNLLWSTFFVDNNTGWIIGSGGFIKKTTNAGDEWIEQNSGTTLTLKSVQFVDQNIGWICGEAGLILKSTDGGANWASLASGTTEHLSDIYFYDADIGYIVGFGGTIIKTTDGGLSWTSLPSGTTNNLYSMDFVDAFIGYAAGDVNETSSVIKTTDGGASWIDKSSGFPRTDGSCLAVEFIDANTGFIGGGDYSGFLYKTSDGGDTWGSSVSPLALDQIEKDTKELLIIYPYTSGISSIYFSDTNNGWYVRWTGMDNYIYSTTNGGITWEYQRSWVEHSLLSVFVTQNGTGLAVGAFGLIYLKAENDTYWSRLLSGTNDNVYSIYFVDGNIGWAGARRWGNPSKDVILKTTNGGKQWKTQLENLNGSYLRSVYFINELFGWIAFSVRALPTETGGGLYRTTDGGENWILENSSGQYSSVFFINHDIGWVTSDYSGAAGIYKSTDGGITLIKNSSTSSSSVYFIDANNGWAAGEGGSILKSTNGGESWVSKASGTTNNLYCIKFYNSDLGICVGQAGTVLLSTDGGENWITETSGTTQDLTTVTFTNSTTVWVVGTNGEILSSTDLGNNWTSYDGVTANDLTSLSFVNEYTGWVGGMSGTMFKYFDESAFTLSLTSPNGWEIWKSGSQRNITWSSENITNVNLYYSTNGGGDWNTIATNVAASGGSYNWTVPTLTPFISFKCKVKIEDASNSTLYDESNNNFIIWHLCNIIQYANLGQRTIDFLETEVDLSLNVTTSDNISVNYYSYETPTFGTLPTGIETLSNYYWQISSTNLIFNNGKIIVPLSSLRGVTDASTLVWLKRTNPGDDWENIGGIVAGENLESTILFNSFSEFAIGSTDPANPLPVELYSFTAVSNPDKIILKWKTETETNNYGFEIERKVQDLWQKLGFVQGNGNSNSPKEYTYLDESVIGGSKFQYRLKQIDNNGQFEYSATVEVEIIPTEFALFQNYPNPFNPSTTIRFSLPAETKLKINIYNMLGELVETLAEADYEAGFHKVTFNASKLPSGVYIYRIESSKFTQVRKMIVLK